LDIKYLVGSIPHSPATSAVFVSRISSADVHPHIVTLADTSFLILYANTLAGFGDNFIFCNKFVKSGTVYTDGGLTKISNSIIDPVAKFYSSVNHDGQRIWLVWQDYTGQNIYGQKFDSSGNPQGSEKVLLNRPTGNLELYGNSGRISTSTVDFDITYKETEGGVEKTLIASFTDQGV
jgi:hypothetical protein